MKSLKEAMVEVLMSFFEKQQCPSRSTIVEKLKHDFGFVESVVPRLDLVVGLQLNSFVDHGLLKRLRGKFYSPGDKYLVKA